MTRRVASSLGHPIRSLRRSPGYAAASVTSVAIGLALSAATFAFVDTVLHPRLLSPDADRIFIERLRFGNQKTPPSVGDRVRLLRSVPGVEDVAVMIRASLGEIMVDGLENAGAVIASSNYWRVQAVAPRLGHYPTDDEASTGRAAIVSHELWQRQFGKRTALEGASIRIGNRFYDIAAVLPEEVRGFGVAAAWLPYAGTTAIDTLRQSAYTGSAQISVKLKPWVTVASVQPALDLVATNLSRQYVQGVEQPYRLQLMPTVSRRQNFDATTVLMYLLGFGILSIGCVNVMALTLARGLARRRDFALRRALGAGRGALASEVLGEVAVVTLLGSVIGVGIAAALLGIFRAATPPELTWFGLQVPLLNLRTLAYCGTAMLGAVAMGGAFPAILASRVAPNEPLKDGAGTTTGRSRSEFRVLLIAELAIAMVLLMMASLETVALRNVMTFDYGFAQRAVVRASVRAGARRATFSPGELRVMRLRSLDVVRATPGIRAGAVAGERRVVPDGQVVSDRSMQGEPVLRIKTHFTAGARYFTTLGVRIRDGRDFVEGDLTGPGAAILSVAAAHELFPRGDALGHQIKIGAPDRPSAWIQVVGVAENFWEYPTDDAEDRDPQVFIAEADSAFANWTLIARADSSAAALVSPMQAHLRDVLPPQSSVAVHTFAEEVDRAVGYMTYFVRVFGALGVAALVLSALGLFSVMSYVVRQRSREFAVRISLGASPTHLVRIVLRSAFELALGGTAIGALLSFWASAGMSSMLFGVKNTDPVSLIIAEATLIGVCLLASLGPAIRASRANPLDIMRAV